MDNEQRNTPARGTPAAPTRQRRKRALIVFSLLCLLLGGILVVYPFLPLLRYAVAPPDVNHLPYASRLDRLPSPGTSPPSPTPAVEKPKPVGNRIVIPKIGVDIPAVEGANDAALLHGAWRIPETSPTPTEGNIVFSAHRFRYRPPSSKTFYLLDKVREGDVVILYWGDEEYDYSVTDVREVGPDDVGILRQTDAPRLTLYTCTPLFSTARRLVVVAEPLE